MIYSGSTDFIGIGGAVEADCGGVDGGGEVGRAGVYAYHAPGAGQESGKLA